MRVVRKVAITFSSRFLVREIDFGGDPYLARNHYRISHNIRSNEQTGIHVGVYCGCEGAQKK